MFNEGDPRTMAADGQVDLVETEESRFQITGTMSESGWKAAE